MDSGCRSNSASVPAATTSPPCTPGAGPEVNDVIRAPHGVLVVLDHHHRVAAGLQLVQRRQQLLVVARVQADGRLVQDVEHAAEIRAQLRRQPDALRLAAGKRRHAAAQLQVAEADLPQELQPLANLRQDVAGDLRRAAGELELAEELEPPPRPASARTSSIVGAAF